MKLLYIAAFYALLIASALIVGLKWLFTYRSITTAEAKARGWVVTE